MNLVKLKQQTRELKTLVADIETTIANLEVQDESSHWLNMKELATAAGVSRSTIYNWLNQHGLKELKNEKGLINYEEFLAWQDRTVDAHV